MHNQGHLNKPISPPRQSKCDEDGNKWEKIFYRQLSEHRNHIFLNTGSGGQRRSQRHVLSDIPYVRGLIHKNTLRIPI